MRLSAVRNEIVHLQLTEANQFYMKSLSPETPHSLLTFYKRQREDCRTHCLVLFYADIQYTIRLVSFKRF